MHRFVECWSRAPAAFLMIMLLVSAMAPQAFALDVALTVREREGVARTGEIVTSGVPLPRGQIFSDQAVAIQGTDAQFQTLATWGDGSVRWLLWIFLRSGSGKSVYKVRNV